MDKQSNELLQRSSIVNISRLLYACIVLAVGVGLGALIKNYTAHMTGLDATIHALEAAKVIVDRAHAEARGGRDQK
jgi:hypothetical protein